MVDGKLSPELDVFDTFTYLLICPFSMLASLLLLVAHIAYKELRKQPGDLIIMISLSELVLAAHWFMSAFRTSYITSPYDDNSTFCIFNSWIAVIAASMDTFYNLCFFAYIIFALKNSMKTGFMPKLSFHVCTIFIVMFVLYRAKRGRNNYGTCSSELTGSNLRTGAFIMFVSICFSAWVYLYTKRNLPRGGLEMAEIRSNFLNFYGSYLKAYLVILSVVFIGMLCQTQAENQNEPGSFRNYQGYLFNLGRIGNSSKALLPILLFFIRCQDPLIQRHVFRPIRKVQGVVRKFTFFGMSPVQKKQIEDPLEAGISSPLEDSFEEEAITPRHRNALENELYNNKEDDMSWMNLLPSKLKETLTRTFIGGIYTCYPGLISTLIHGNVKALPYNSTEACKYNLKGEELMLYLQTNEAISDFQLTVYAPIIFRDILVNNNKLVNFEKSLDVNMNAETIKKAGENKGGASGELFMFSHDNKLILKTITNDEFVVFTDILYNYSEYLKYNKSSQIARIYGMFEFRFTDSEKTMKLIVMENLFTLPSNAILRKFDLKGSTFSRKVKKSYDGFDKYSPEKEVMKDLDFLEIEKHINCLDKGRRMEILASLRRDVDFFTHHNIIDYSMVVAVVSKRLCSQESLYEELKSGAYHVIQSPNPDFFFVIGIIDYFQRYTFSKMMEKCWKKTSNFSPNLNTSSQPPEKYGARFFQFSERILV